MARQVKPFAAGEVGEPQDRPVILIIEDDASLRTALRLLLVPAGYNIIEASDGLSGLEMFSEHRPDLVLLDLMMPGMDGFTTCARLRELPDGDFVPILVVTALEDRHSIDRAFQMGVTDYITKPVNREVLRLRVRHLLSATRAEKMILRAKQEWEATFDAVSDMVMLTDEAGTLIRCNRATVDRLETNFQTVLGENIETIMPALVHFPSPDKGGRLGEFQIEGEEGTFEASVYPLALQGGSGRVYVVQDITERKDLQARMIATQKLADLGTLAAGVAHEINSPLQVITGVSESLLERHRSRAAQPARSEADLRLTRPSDRPAHGRRFRAAQHDALPPARNDAYGASAGRQYIARSGWQILHLAANDISPSGVILNGAKRSEESPGAQVEILRLRLRMTLAQSRRAKLHGLLRVTSLRILHYLNNHVALLVSLFDVPVRDRNFRQRIPSIYD